MKAFLNTLQGKVITGLTIITLIMGIGLEVIQFQTAYWTMRKVRIDSLNATILVPPSELGSRLNPDPDKMKPRQWGSLDGYRKALKHAGFTPERGYTQEEINRMVVLDCKKAEGEDSPICKE